MLAEIAIVMPALPLLAAAAIAVTPLINGERTIRLAAAAGWTSVGLTALLVILSIAGLPSRGAFFAFDGLAALISVLIVLVGAVVLQFSVRYMRGDPDLKAYTARVALAVASMLVVASAADLVVLLAAWVIGGQVLARLIGHSDAVAESAAAARRTRLTFFFGDAIFAVGLGILAGNAGSTSIAEVLSSIPNAPPTLVAGAAILILFGALARSAVLPFSSWLLSSLTAPTPVSALMHAGFVNAGGFALVKFSAVFASAPWVLGIAIFLGAASAILGTAVMLVRPDVKRALAASTVSQMGFMILQCGLGAFGPAVWHLIAHGFFKAWLFLSAGSAVSQTTAPRSKGPGALVAGALALAFAIVVAFATGSSPTSLLLTTLAVATAAHSAVALAGPAIDRVDRWALLCAVAVLAAVHLVGLVLVTAALNGAAAKVPNFGFGVEIALTALFIGLWVVQMRGLRLPLAVYVRLMNAGRLAPSAIEPIRS